MYKIIIGLHWVYYLALIWCTAPVVLPGPKLSANQIARFLKMYISWTTADFDNFLYGSIKSYWEYIECIIGLLATLRQVHCFHFFVSLFLFFHFYYFFNIYFLLCFFFFLIFLTVYFNLVFSKFSDSWLIFLAWVQTIFAFFFLQPKFSRPLNYPCIAECVESVIHNLVDTVVVSNSL